LPRALAHAGPELVYDPPGVVQPIVVIANRQVRIWDL
jgi:hypothetical protein